MVRDTRTWLPQRLRVRRCALRSRAHAPRPAHARRRPTAPSASSPAASPGPSARVELRRPRGAWRAIADGSMGLAEGYLAGDWDTPDLDAVLALGLANIAEKPAGAHSALDPLHRVAARAARQHAARAASATSRPTTTSATTSTACGSTRR